MYIKNYVCIIYRFLCICFHIITSIKQEKKIKQTKRAHPFPKGVLPTPATAQTPERGGRHGKLRIRYSHGNLPVLHDNQTMI